MTWKILIEHHDCPDSYLDNGRVFCSNELSDSQYCQKETCPRKISIEFEDERQKRKIEK